MNCCVVDPRLTCKKQSSDGAEFKHLAVLFDEEFLTSEHKTFFTDCDLGNNNTIMILFNPSILSKTFISG